MNSKGLVLAILPMTLSGVAVAYETETHALMTRQAYQNSVLTQTGDTSLLHRLGLDRSDAPNPFSPY